MKISTRFLLVWALLLVQFSALAATITITVGDTFFSPANAVARPGDVVVWQWQSGNHPTAFDNNEFAPFVMSVSSPTHSQAMSAPGTFTYHCNAHSTFNTTTNRWEGMTAAITVSNATPVADARPATPTLSVYPNPAKGIVTVSLSQKPGQDYKLRLSNIIGREVRTLALKPEFAGEGVVVNLSDLPAGIYFYSLLLNDKVLTTKRLVLQN